ncbi:hypothetical protein GCM10018980_23020 [Streptomyces capoamus]|uniref:Uncharacterized protein n=1 Tax=Streptomyces capoamus TaxID=68183 RepID=A0A919C396_9ACTN|nr:hypothetical protein GCM10010501_00870 [Streptomyces libani subsp. rufus]GHG44785.1 hypothetical protein GCM10018980_23020 [Streptomyces capoamus]
MQYHPCGHQFTDPSHVDRRPDWLRDVHAAMQPHLGTGGCINGMDPEPTDWPGSGVPTRPTRPLDAERRTPHQPISPAAPR